MTETTLRLSRDFSLDWDDAISITVRLISSVRGACVISILLTKIVKNNQLEFVNGGWTAHDEACNTY